MGRYLGPICRLCRREGMKLCDKHKCASVRRNYPPGPHGKESHGKKSDYSKQLREKQKARRIFGVSEKQILRYYEKATASPEESGLQLLRGLEHRFDNAVFRAGLADTRRQARQLVSHGIILLNGRRTTAPSRHLRIGDVFHVREKNKTMPLFESFAKKKTAAPQWLKVEPQDLKVTVVGKAIKEDVEQSISPQIIIEFYSR